MGPSKINKKLFNLLDLMKYKYILDPELFINGRN